MKKALLRVWKSFRLKNLERKNVAYSSEKEEIVIKKGGIKVVLKAVFHVEDDDDYVMQISGDHIVVENDVVEAIWKVLWNEKITDLCICDDCISDTAEESSSNSSNANDQSASDNNDTIEYAECSHSVPICFCDVRVVSRPNFLKIQKDEVIPID